MNKHSITLKCILLSIFLPLSASTAYAEQGGISASLKGGKGLLSDLPGVTVNEEAAAGINIGYQFTDNWSAEIEYIKGSFELTGNRGSVTIDSDTTAAYAAFRSDGDFYFAGRIGIIQLELSSDTTVPDASESGLSYGGGVGYQILPNLGVELDYTIVEEDQDWLMLSARFSF